MQKKPYPARIGLHARLTIAQVTVMVISLVVAEALALVVAARVLDRLPITPAAEGLLHLLLTLVVVTPIGLLLSAWVNRPLSQRLKQTLDVSRAWMRGNLSVRVSDAGGDEIGQLAGQLNLLAEHLEEDEQDLEVLRERNARLTDQVRALAVVEERNRLARELHDSVKQQLFSLAMTASGLRTRMDAQGDAPAEIGEVIREIESTAQAAQREMTRLIQDLKPSSLHDQGLASALNDYTLILGAREHLLIYLEVQGDDALLPPAVSEALYRVAQEALHNIARHARATRVDVDLRCIPEQVSLTLEDNGVGFDVGATHEGLGLGGMQERMLKVGGLLTVDSQPGIGTTITAEVALPHPLGVRPGVDRIEGGHPLPAIANWPWLGRKLTIPVGQVWPWLPADQVHLRRPLVEVPDGKHLLVRHSFGLLGLWKSYVLQPEQGAPILRVQCGRSGYEWEAEGASWALRHVRGVSGRMILTRNGLPLAAMQPQGRMLHTWSEIVYDNRGYRLSYVKEPALGFILADEAGDALITAEGSDPDRFRLHRPLPLPLVVMATMRVADEIVAEKEETPAQVALVNS